MIRIEIDNATGVPTQVPLILPQGRSHALRIAFQDGGSNVLRPVDTVITFALYAPGDAVNPIPGTVVNLWARNADTEDYTASIDMGGAIVAALSLTTVYASIRYTEPGQAEVILPDFHARLTAGSLPKRAADTIRWEQVENPPEMVISLVQNPSLVQDPVRTATERLALGTPAGTYVEQTDTPNVIFFQTGADASLAASWVALPKDPTDTGLAAITAADPAALRDAAGATAGVYPSAVLDGEVVLAKEMAEIGAIPTSRNLAAIARQIVNGFARVKWLGDSTGSASNSPRVTQGIIKSWDVDWAGFLSTSASQSPDEGQQAFLVGDSVSFGDAILTDGSTAPFGIRAKESASGTVTFTRQLFTSLPDYKNGVWVNNVDLSARILMPDLNTPVPDGRVIFRRDNSNVAEIGNVTFDGGSDYRMDLDVTATAGQFSATNNVELLYGVFSGSTGQFFGYGGTFLYQTAALVERRGFFWCGSRSSGGWSTTDHLAPMDDGVADPTYQDADGSVYQQELINELSALGELAPEFYFIQLGINISNGEGFDTLSSQQVYQANIEKILARYRAAHTAAQTVDSNVPDPKFVLVVPWDTSDSVLRRHRQAVALDNIALRNPSDVATLALGRILRQRESLWSNWQSTYTSDGTHQSVVGTVEFGALMWAELLAASRTVPEPMELDVRRSSSVIITADNQTLNLASPVITLSSDDATAANRTFTLSGGTIGKVYTLVWSGTNAGQLEDIGVQKLTATWEPSTDYESILIYYDGLNYIEISRNAP